MAVLLSIHDWVVYLLQLLEKWKLAILNPNQFLEPLFHPAQDQIADGLEFYFAVIAFSFILFAPFVLGQSSDFAEKARVAASSLVGLASSAVVAMTWHFVFSMVGGGASFSGTYLAYVYAAGPYVPLSAFASLIVFASLPADYRRYALNPALAQAAANRSKDDPRTKKGLNALGVLLALGLLIWSGVVLFRCLSFIHALAGWKLAGAIAISMLVAAPVAAVLRAVGGIFNPPDTSNGSQSVSTELQPRSETPVGPGTTTGTKPQETSQQ